MFKQLSSWILLDLGDFEEEFRQFHLQDTITLYKLTAIFVAIANMSMLFIDSLFMKGAGDLFAWVVVIRSMYTAFTLMSIIVIQRPSVGHTRLEEVTFVWVIVTGIYFILFNFTRPSNYLSTNIDILLIFGIYVLTSMRMSWLTALAVSFSVGSLIVAYYFKPDASIVTRITATWTHIFIQILGVVSAIQIETYRRRAFLAYVHEREAREAATTMLRIDSLTQSLTRQYFLELAEQEFERANRYAHPLAVLMLDLDHFKDINDEYGHRAGDEALQKFSRMILEQKRQSDLFGRLGGEEFGLILPETDLKNAQAVAQRIQEEWAKTHIEVSSLLIHSTVSIGVTVVSDRDQAFEDVLIRADEVLYKAKQNGRNRVEAIR